MSVSVSVTWEGLPASKMPFGEKIAKIFVLSDYFVFGLSTTHPRGESPPELKRVGKSGILGNICVDGETAT